MTGEERGGYCHMSANRSCCKIEPVVSIDERDQMVLPKETGKKADVNFCKSNITLRSTGLNKSNMRRSVQVLLRGLVRDEAWE